MKLNWKNKTTSQFLRIQMLVEYPRFGDSDSDGAGADVCGGDVRIRYL